MYRTADGKIQIAVLKLIIIFPSAVVNNQTTAWTLPELLNIS